MSYRNGGTDGHGLGPELDGRSHTPRAYVSALRELSHQTTKRCDDWLDPAVQGDSDHAKRAESRLLLLAGALEIAAADLRAALASEAE